jgi:hypothetical protein
MKKKLVYCLFAVIVLFVLACPNPEEDENGQKQSDEKKFVEFLGFWQGFVTDGYLGVPYPSFYITSKNVIRVSGISNVGPQEFRENSSLNFDITNQIDKIDKVSDNVLLLKTGAYSCLPMSTN